MGICGGEKGFMVAVGSREFYITTQARFFAG